jgi:hypothetical protein
LLLLLILLLLLMMMMLMMMMMPMIRLHQRVKLCLWPCVAALSTPIGQPSAAVACVPELWKSYQEDADADADGSTVPTEHTVRRQFNVTGVNCCQALVIPQRTHAVRGISFSPFHAVSQTTATTAT